jgi:hypothetical protein
LYKSLTIFLEVEKGAKDRRIIRDPKSHIGMEWHPFRLTRVVGFKLPSWSGGVAAASADGVVVFSVRNPQSPDWCTSPHVSKGESLTASNEIQNPKSKIDLTLLS